MSTDEKDLPEEVQGNIRFLKSKNTWYSGLSLQYPRKYG